MIDLRALVLSPHWRWVPGMAWLECRGKGWVLAAGRVREEGNHPTLAEPDLTDPATLGCLLALVREAWKDPGATCAPVLSGQVHLEDWEMVWYAPHLNREIRGATEADALAAALLGAP